MITHRSAPLLVGTGVIVLMAAALAVREPLPAGLSSSHAGLPNLTELSGCTQCHAEGGLARGCLGCHDEIAAQLDDRHGLHHDLLQGQDITCGGCHGEHYGAPFQLVGPLSWDGRDPREFDHSHTLFLLEGKHDELECEECHTREFSGVFTLSEFPDRPRKKTFLGLRQDCITCHENIHGARIGNDCEHCHDQEQFDPASLFDHDRSFPLGCAHREIACEDCHFQGEDERPGQEKRFIFEEVRGETCAECHESPHVTLASQECGGCHLEQACLWAGALDHTTPPEHAKTGFSLTNAHAEVDCARCHDPELPLDERYHDPREENYLRQQQTCRGCHDTPHMESLGEDCARCHEVDARPWAAGVQTMPVEYHAASGFDLDPAHRSVECESCHEQELSFDERYRDPSDPAYERQQERCESCHDTPHHFERDDACRSCHLTSAHTFADGIREVTPDIHETLGFSLEVPHTKIDCASCHEPEIPFVDRYQSPARVADRCESCHEDIHAGQFAERYERCRDCHEKTHFLPAGFGIEDHDVFSLTGAHGAVSCRSCHELDEATGVRQFVGVATSCKECHESPHGEQFLEEIRENDCTFCHHEVADDFLIEDFDHEKRTGYPLTGRHGEAACADCHEQRLQADGSFVRQYRDTPTECASCHEEPHVGQFAEEGTTNCERCHGSSEEWKADLFDHDRDSRFPLDNSHENAPCSACHLEVQIDLERSYVHYKPLGTECEDCHERPVR